MPVTAIKLDGSMTLTPHTINNSYETVALSYKYAEEARDAYDATTISDIEVASAPTYYIKLTGDLNRFVSHSASAGEGVDDAWGLSEIAASKTALNSFTASYNLPASDQSVTIGQVNVSADSTARDAGVTDSTTFSLAVQCAVSNAGVMSFTVGTYAGTEISPSIAENSTLEQHLYKNVLGWGVADGARNGTDVDELSITYTAANDTSPSSLKSDLESELRAYDGANVFSDFSVSISAIAESNSNVLTKYANYLGKNNASVGTTLFDAGSQIWVNDSGLEKNARVTIKDHSGALVDMLNDSVGVVFQQE